MASRGAAKRPEGTDGSDYQSRTVIANRYLASAKAKSRMKMFIFAHYILHVVTVSIMMLCKHLEKDQAKINQNPFVVSPWLLVWLGSSIPCGLAYISLSKNKLALIIVYVWGSIFLGFCPLAMALYQLFNTKHDPAKMIFILDVVALPIAELFICVLGCMVQLGGFINAKILRDAWMSRKES